MAPAMHERPWSLRPLDAGEPIIAVIAVALQELSSKALQELFAMDPTASGRISEQHDWRVSATVSAIVGGDRPEEAFLRSPRSEEHTSELQSTMRISYAVFCLKKKNTME